MSVIRRLSICICGFMAVFIFSQARAFGAAPNSRKIPAPFTLTPTSQSVNVSPNIREVLSFVATNVSSSTTAFGANVSCTGAITGCVAPSSFGIDMGKSYTIEVGFNAGAPSTTGTITLKVWVGTDTLQGVYTVTMNPIYGVNVTPSVSIVTATASGSGTIGYSVKNTGSVSTTYALSASCPGGTAGAIASCSAPANVTVAAGATSVVNVSYTATGTLNNTSAVNLTATYMDATATGTVTVTVGSGGMAVDIISPNSGSAVAHDQCLTFGDGKDGAYECGTLRLTHALPTVRSRGKARTPTLLFNSQYSSPYYLVAANVTLPTVPTSVTATLVINGVTRGSGTWSGSDWMANSTRRIALGFAAVNDSTGAYTYTLTVSSITGGVPTSTTVSGTLIVVNRQFSIFGAGWWLAGLEQINVMSNGERLWIAGDGSARIYHIVTANSVWVADNIDRPDTLKLVGSTYTRYAEHGVRVQFNSLGQHIYTINRLNDTTKFVYTGTAMTSLVVPSGGTGITYSFTYGNTGGLLSAVSCLGRTSTIVMGSQGRIFSIMDPDNQSVLYGYISGTTQMLVRTDRNGHKTWYAYNSSGRLAVDSTPVAAPGATIVTRFTPAESRGFIGASHATPLTSVYTEVDGPRTDVADTTMFFLNRYGAPVKIVNATGDSTIIQRAHNTYPAAVTSLRRPNGFTTVAQYDGRGNLTKSTDLSPFGTDINAISQYSWDPLWDFVTKIQRPEGDSVNMAYDTTNGNQLWQQDGRGSTKRTLFRYYSSSSTLGRLLLSAVQQPSGRVDSLVYANAFNNLSATRSPNNIWTYHYYDSFGRDTLDRIPVDSPQTVFVHDTTVYDAMDRVVRSVTFGSPNRSIVVTQYDHEGNVTQVQRSASDNTTLGTLTTSTHYDEADRPTIAVAVDGNADTTYYNPAGSVIKTSSRLGDTVTMQYDALNRLTRRFSNGKRIHTTTESNGAVYPRYGVLADSLTILADTAKFSYNANGNLLNATNIGALIHRTYYPNGLLATDTQVVRCYPHQPTLWGDTTSYPHRYGLGYTYDRDGRRTALAHSFNLSGSYTARTLYTYDPATGWVNTIKDMQGNAFAFGYDVDGRAVRTSFPGGTWDSTSYNADDAVIRRTVYNTTTRGNGYWAFPIMNDEAMTRDPRGKLVLEVTGGGLIPIDTNQAYYSTLGHLITAVRRQPFSDGLGHVGTQVDSEYYALDALANLQTMNLFERDTVYNSGHRSSSTASYTYQTAVMGQGTGRLVSRNLVTSTETYAYDAAGNQNRTTASGNPASINHPYYDGLGKLRIIDQRTGAISGSSDSLWHYDEFFYDALGRVVLTRSRAFCSAAYNQQNTYARDATYYYSSDDGRCHNKIRRTVWDGNQMAWEIQYNGNPGTNPPDEFDQSYGPAEISGKVNYTNSSDLDHPLGVLRFDYQSATSYIPPTPTLVVPHYNWKGAPLFPTFDSGQVQKCGSWSGAPVLCLAVLWPAMGQSYEKVVKGEMSWHGSFADNATQGSGLQYKRNRFYDPNTGQFTQEDPIGLAGGLNAYGFAGGDPTNYSDPLGLCPPGMTIEQCFEYIVSAGDLRSLVSAQAHQVQENLAALGRSWSAQRQAFWKAVSRSSDANENWSSKNIERMKTGRAPKLPSESGKEESAELSHEPIPQREGGTSVVPRTPDQHAAVDPFRRLPLEDAPISDMPAEPVEIPEFPIF